jgi:hypothetical protein
LVFGEVEYVYKTSATTTTKLCVKAGYWMQDMHFKLKTNSKFLDCYRSMIDCLFDWTLYSGPDAKIFEKCKLGSDQTVTIYTSPTVTNTGGVYTYLVTE